MISSEFLEIVFKWVILRVRIQNFPTLQLAKQKSIAGRRWLDFTLDDEHGT
jgi:hypothetical protein